MHFHNGTTVDVAKVEGSPAYKHIIRLAGDASQAPDPGIPYSADRNGRDMTQTILDSLGLRDHLPPWLGGLDEPTQAVAAMLKSLKTATEAYVDVPETDANVALPFVPSATYKGILHAALSSIPLDAPTWASAGAPSPAGEYAAWAHGLTGHCAYYPEPGDPKDDPEQLILTIDHNRAGLSALLLDEECGVLERRRTLYGADFGADALLHRCKGAVQPDDECLANLRQAMRQLTELPLKSGNGAGLMHISELVLHGDSTSDPRLHSVLKDVLREHQGLNITTLAERWHGTIDPVFAASRGLAQVCFERLENYRQDSLLDVDL